MHMHLLGLWCYDWGIVVSHNFRPYFLLWCSGIHVLKVKCLTTVIKFKLQSDLTFPIRANVHLVWKESMQVILLMKIPC